MKNVTLIIIFVAIVLGGGGMYLYSQQTKPQEDLLISEKESTIKDPSANVAQDSTMKDEKALPEEKYVPYSKEVLDETTDKRRVLFFYASWCPQCIPADKNFQANSGQIPKDVVLIRVNYNDPETDAEEKALATEYGVTYQHTYVQIDASGNEVAKWNGGQIEELLSHLK